MTKLNPFRISFDSPLRPRERIRARVTATVVSVAVIFLGATSLLWLLNMSSEAIGNWSNAQPQPDVRMLTTDAGVPAGKTCDEQTWPYLEARCLKTADPADQNGQERSTPRHGLGSQHVALPTTAPTTTAQAPELRPTPEAVTTGSSAASAVAPQAEREPPPSLQTVSVPIPVPAPDLATPSASDPSRNASESERTQQSADPRASPREQRQLRREERAKLRRERRQEARKLREERLQARREARRERIVRRWTEYTYRSPSGVDERVIVIRRGSRDDEFFSTIR